MPTQKIHYGKGQDGLRQSQHPITKDDITGEEFQPGPAKLRVEARLTKDENAQLIGMDKIDVELVKRIEPEATEILPDIEEGFAVKRKFEFNIDNSNTDTILKKGKDKLTALFKITIISTSDMDILSKYYDYISQYIMSLLKKYADISFKLYFNFLIENQHYKAFEITAETDDYDLNEESYNAILESLKSGAILDVLRFESNGKIIQKEGDNLKKGSGGVEKGIKITYLKYLNIAINTSDGELPTSPKNKEKVILAVGIHPQNAGNVDVRFRSENHMAKKSGGQYEVNKGDSISLNAFCDENKWRFIGWNSGENTSELRFKIEGDTEKVASFEEI